MRTYFARLAIYFYISLFCVSALFYFIFTTQKGLEYSFQIIKPFLPGQLQIANVEGTLLSPLTLKNIRYQHGAQTLLIESLSIEWSPWNYLRDEWPINHLRIHHAVLNQNKKNIVSLEGTLQNKWNIQWNIKIPNLLIFHAQAHGDFTSHGTITGDRLKPVLTASFESKKLMIANQGIDRAQGKLRGTFNLLTHLGEIHLLDGSFRIPVLGLRPNHVTLNALVQNQQILFTGNFQSGKGTGELRGKVDLTRSNYPIEANVTGNNLDILHLSDYKISATPNLLLSYSDGHLDVKGSLLIPSAEIDPTDFSEAVTLPQEVVFVTSSSPQIQSNTTKNDISLHIQLSLGDKIYIHYHDLDATLQGKIAITQNPGGLPLGTGELYTTKGTYRAYGKTLSILEGRLIYLGGELTNPGLDIKAGRTVQAVQVDSTNNFANTTTTSCTEQHNESLAFF